MKLIDFQGLNCYQNSLITVASFMGVDYKRAFVSLWPERDFEYDSCHDVYVTKRMTENLKSLGMEIKISDFNSETEAMEGLSVINEGEAFLICMDTFHIPWSLTFNVVHDLHYFAALKEPSGVLSCFDPTYNVQCTVSDEIASFFFRIYRIKRVEQVEGKAVFNESCHEEIIKFHPQMQNEILDKLRKCVNEHRRNTLLLAKYIDAMINNRYLYKHYLDNTPLSPAEHKQLFDINFFSRWNAVKNGLYKAYIVKNNDEIIKEVSGLFKSLTDDELLTVSKLS